MNTPLQFKGLKEPVTLFDYYTKIKLENPLIKYTIGLPSLIVKALKGKNEIKRAEDKDAPIELSEKQKDVQKIMEDNIGVMVDDQNGYVTVWCILPEDYAAAQLAKKTQLLLQKYITEFKIEKAKANHDLFEQRYEEAKKKYQKVQAELASFKDRNKNVVTATARSEQEQLTSEYTLIFGVYSELAKKLEQAKIDIKEETPVFTIIKPVSVPTEKYKPNRPYIIGIFAFLGLLTGMGIVLGRDYASNFKVKWKAVSIEKLHEFETN
jgi:LPS O-antigen subunit length determinant protein (WzzB/FepE family)